MDRDALELEKLGAEIRELRSRTRASAAGARKQALEQDKLRAEAEDLRARIEASVAAAGRRGLEEDKLRAETEDLRTRTRTSRSTLRLERLKVYPTYLAVIATILFGTFQYFQQREAQLAQQAREQQFKVTSEMVQLTKQLDTPASPALQRSAALQLAMFHQHAVPILIENLDIDRKEVVLDSTVTALEATVETENDLARVLTDLKTSADRVFNREIQEETPTTRSILAHIRALGALGAKTVRPSAPAGSGPLWFLSSGKKAGPPPPDPTVPAIRASVKLMLRRWLDRIDTGPFKPAAKAELRQAIAAQLPRIRD